MPDSSDNPRKPKNSGGLAPSGDVPPPADYSPNVDKASGDVPPSGGPSLGGVGVPTNNISFDIPKDLADTLAKSAPNISQAAKEAFLVDLYRRRAITLRVLREALGIARIEVDAILARYEVPNDLSVEDFSAQAQALRNRPQ